MICSLKEKGKDIQVCFMKEERIFYFERNASGEYLFRIFNFKRSCFEEYDSGFRAIFNYKIIGIYYHNHTAAAIGILDGEHCLIHLDFFNERLRTMDITPEIAELFLHDGIVSSDENRVYIQFCRNGVFNALVCDLRQGIIEKESDGFALYSMPCANCFMNLYTVDLWMSFYFRNF